MLNRINQYDSFLSFKMHQKLKQNNNSDVKNYITNFLTCSMIIFFMHIMDLSPSKKLHHSEKLDRQKKKTIATLEVFNRIACFGESQDVPLLNLRLTFGFT